MQQGKQKKIHDFCDPVWSTQGVIPRNYVQSMYNISHENTLIIFAQYYTVLQLSGNAYALRTGHFGSKTVRESQIAWKEWMN